MLVYLIGLSSGFGLGWLSHIWRMESLRSRQRGGYLKPGVFTSTSPATGTSGTSRIRVGFSSFDPPGHLSAVTVWPLTQDQTSSTGAPISSGDVTAARGASGLRLAASVDSDDHAADSAA